VLTAASHSAWSPSQNNNIMMYCWKSEPVEIRNTVWF
jgi:hypothetical protein